MNVLSLFDGLSGGQIALERCGIKVDKYYASEIDKSAILITQYNYPNTIQLGDVTSVTKNSLENIDLLIGGSPCQGFSKLGVELNFEDHRSKLFFEYVRLLKELKPKYFMLENVVMQKESKDIITKYLGVEPILIDSALVSGQRRKRLYWTNIPNVVQPRDKGIIYKNVLEDLKWRDIPQFVYGKFGDNDRINGLNWINNSKSNTLTTNNSHTFQYLLNEDKTKCRLMSAREWERLQTLPEGYTDCLPKTKACHAIGNGWTVDVIAHIFKALKCI